MANGHGGPRANSGGARPNSGPKPKPPVIAPGTTSDDSLKFLIDVMKDGSIPVDLRIKAATVVAQYTLTKKGEGGKKKEREEAALKAAVDKFAPPKPPKLKIVNG